VNSKSVQQLEGDFKKKFDASILQDVSAQKASCGY